MHPPRKGGEDRDQVLYQLFLHRTRGFLVNNVYACAMARKIVLQVIEPEPCEPIRVGNNHHIDFFQFDERAQFFQSRTARIQATPDIRKDVSWRDLLILAKFLRCIYLPVEVAFLFLVMR